jgi:hypothetical protein
MWLIVIPANEAVFSRISSDVVSGAVVMFSFIGTVYRTHYKMVFVAYYT